MCERCKLGPNRISVCLTTAGIIDYSLHILRIVCYFNATIFVVWPQVKRSAVMRYKECHLCSSGRGMIPSPPRSPSNYAHLITLNCHYTLQHAAFHECVCSWVLEPGAPSRLLYRIKCTQCRCALFKKYVRYTLRIIHHVDGGLSLIR